MLDAILRRLIPNHTQTHDPNLKRYLPLPCWLYCSSRRLSAP